MKTSRRLFIIEGPDGAGKSILAGALSVRTDAPIVHLGPFRDVSEGLERLYVEATLPAVLGYSNIILDRSWLSEHPYGTVFRKGVDRLGVAATRQLERLALRCRTVVIRALPPKDVVIENFVRRKRKCAEAEMLDHVIQAEKVYDIYRDDFRTALPTIEYDYTMISSSDMIENLLAVPTLGYNPHPLSWRSAGNLEAKVILIGDSFVSHKNRDILYQWPFSTFGGGPAKWLALRLERAGIPESALFWINADNLTLAITGWLATTGKKIVALGSTAESVLRTAGVPVTTTTGHPNTQSRYKTADPEDYELIGTLKEMLS